MVFIVVSNTNIKETIVYFVNGFRHVIHKQDSHGVSAFARNVLSSWIGQLVLILSGFIVPRLIDRGLGQEALGVWDFSWSLVSHLYLIQAGLTGSVNRYVARYRTEGNLVELNRAVSSVAFVLRIMGGIVLLLTALCIWFMPVLLKDSLRAHLTEACWLVFLLGLSIVLQISTSVYAGVLTGCHRWDLHNAIYTGTYLFMLVGMVASLKLGFGLIGLAAVNLTGDSIGRFTRVWLAYRICDGLEVRWRLMHWKTARKMLTFGSKMFIYDCAYLLLSQTTSLLILSYLGAANLAIYSRPLAIVRHIKSFIAKYANVLVPTTSSLQTTGDRQALRSFVLSSSRQCAFITLPPICLLWVMGADVLELWMGPKYANGGLIAALAAAQLFGIAHAPLFSVLAGLNHHGRAGILIFCSAVVSSLSALLWLSVYQGGLIGVAICLGIPWTIANGLILPIYASKSFDLSASELISETWKKPLLCCLPFLGCLLLVRYMHFGNVVYSLFWGIFLGGCSLASTYWFQVIPSAWKNKISSFLSFNLRR